MTERTDSPRYTMVTIAVAPQWHSLIRRAIDEFRARNPRATEAQALDQLLVQGAMHVVREGGK